MAKLYLPQVTLVLADCVDYQRGKKSLDYSTQQIQFQEVKHLTAFKRPDSRVVNIPRLSSIQDYNTFMIRDLVHYFNTTHVLVTQWDGFVWNPQLWKHEFLNYDYIGAPWPPELLHTQLHKDRGYLVGNGGFSLRSKKLQQVLHDNYDNLDFSHPSEDVVICQFNRELLESHGCVFAPVEVARQFSWECEAYTQHTFGVHARLRLP